MKTSISMILGILTLVSVLDQREAKAVFLSRKAIRKYDAKLDPSLARPRVLMSRSRALEAMRKKKAYNKARASLEASKVADSREAELAPTSEDSPLLGNAAPSSRSIIGQCLSWFGFKGSSQVQTGEFRGFEGSSISQSLVKNKINGTSIVSYGAVSQIDVSSSAK